MTPKPCLILLVPLLSALGCGESEASPANGSTNTDSGSVDSGADSDENTDAASDAGADSPSDGETGPVRHIRFVHTLSNLGSSIVLCVRPDSNTDPQATPLTHAQFPDGIPYAESSSFLSVGPELTLDDRLYVDVHRAPLDECPAFNGLSDAPPSFVGFGMTQFINPALRWFTNGPFGLVGSPPGEAVSLCGANRNEPCTPENQNVSWFWSSDDSGAEPVAAEAKVSVMSSWVGTVFATVCWDPDADGSEPAIEIADLEQDGLITEYKTVAPLESGRLFAFAGGGVDCSSSVTPVATLDLPDPAPTPSGAATLPAGSVGRIWLLGQVTTTASSPAAEARIQLLAFPGAP